MDGLYFYNARWYDPSLGRFLSADTIVPSPGNPQSLNRYSYVLNNALKYTDPTGHAAACGVMGQACESDPKPPRPPVVPRSQWGAPKPGTFPSSEGFYDPAQPTKNPSGYARYSDLRPGLSLAEILDTIVIHHEGNLQTYDIRAVLAKHILKSGYTDIGYHFVVGPNGTIYEGRDIGVRGAHVLEGNSGKIGVLLLGDFQPGPASTFLGITIKDQDDPGPTPKQIQSTLALIRWLDRLYGIETVVGHRALNDTACPGDYAMQYIPAFDAAAQEN